MDVAAKKKMAELAARSFFNEMVNYGFDENDVINFTTEILDLLIRKDKSTQHPSPSNPRIYPVNYRQNSNGEIVEILGIPLGTVKSLMHRAVKKLQQSLFDYNPKREKLKCHVKTLSF